MVVAFMMGAPVREVVDTQLHFGTQMPFRVGASIPLLWGDQTEGGQCQRRIICDVAHGCPDLLHTSSASFGLETATNAAATHSGVDGGYFVAASQRAQPGLCT